MINEKKTKKLKKNLKFSLINYFNDRNNKELLLKILGEDNYNYNYFIQTDSKYMKKKNQDILIKDKPNNNIFNEIGSTIKK